MGENHFNKSVMLPMEQVNQLDGDFYVWGVCMKASDSCKIQEITRQIDL